MNDLIEKENKELEVLESSKAAQIKAVFAPMVEMLEGFESAYTEVMEEEQTPEKSAKAKRLRLDISKIRIDADKVRKAQKEEYLRAGNAIQGVYNILKFAVTDKEEKLKEVETYYERIEAEMVAKIAAERGLELSKLEADSTGLDLGNMSEEVWENYLSGIKARRSAIIEAERKAEEERAEAERKRDLENKRRIQCSRLIDFIPGFEMIIFSDLSDAEYKSMVDSAIEKRTAHEKEQEEIRIENDRLKKEAEEREQKAAAERKAHEEEIRKEREERERVEKEQREKAAAEDRAREEEEKRLAAEEEKAAKETDKEKLISHVSALLTGKDSVKSEEAKAALTKAAKILSDCAGEM